MLIDAIFENGRFHTQDPVRPIAHRIGVNAGRIVGCDEELDGVDAIHRIDLAGTTVIPGLHDAHYHLSLTGERLHMVGLRPGQVGSLTELYERISEHAATLPSGEWVRGTGYDQNFLGGEHPDAHELDRASGGRPVVLEHVSGHMLAVSASAFHEIGYSDLRDVPDVEGGRVFRDSSGTATGVLQEDAQQMIYDRIRPISLQTVHRNIVAASEQAIASGLTSISEPGLGEYHVVGNTPVDFHSYLSAIESGEVGLRITAMPYISSLHPIPEVPGGEWLGFDLGIRTGLGDDRFRIGPVKIVSDGSLIGKSAAMHHCYHGEQDSGLMRWDPEALRNTIIDAHRSGWSVATHAIGDRAIDHALDAIQEAQRRAPSAPRQRHRIEHFAVASDEQIRRAASLGVVPVPQGTFISDFGDGILDALGEERGRLAYRMKSLLRAGIEIPGSTDSPISDGNPLRSIHDMVNRRTSSGRDFAAGAEGLTVQEAVRAYTIGSAFAVGQEDRKGVLKRGFLADFVALDGDIFNVPSEEISGLHTQFTVIGGEVVFSR